jgi:hypothetical protein
MDSGPNLEDLMRLGIQTAKAGNKDNARVIFQQVLGKDKRHVPARLWLASLEPDPMKKRAHLETVLRLNPDNATAKKQLASLDRAVERTQNASIRMGIRLLTFLIAAVIIVAVVIFFVVKLKP